jgi:hypothetical protein|tara:strand:- start:636 stop:872 length:237 start_codon:yes stop_codon:yes gene_type:complete
MENELNEYGLYDNFGLNIFVNNNRYCTINEKALLNLARFLYYNANDGAFDNMDEAENEVYNIMRGQFYISCEEEGGVN